MEWSLSTRNSRDIRARESADCRESSVKNRHAMHRVMKMTPEMRHLGSVSREGSDNMFNRTEADGE
jgi:hypothetical protein